MQTASSRSALAAQPRPTATTPSVPASSRPRPPRPLFIPSSGTPSRHPPAAAPHTRRPRSTCSTVAHCCATVDQQTAGGVATGTPQTSYIHPDNLGSTNVITNASGTVVTTKDYYPFGSVRVNTGSASLARGYIGQFEDGNNISYLNNRYYQSDRGQFLSQDPVFRAIGTPEVERLAGAAIFTDPQQLNSYSYARNNPIRYIDPLGLFNIQTGTIEKGDTLGDIRNQINGTFGTSLSVSQIAAANNISNPNRIFAGGSIALPGQNASLSFNGQTLQVYDKTYSTAVPTLAWQGVSGNSRNSAIPQGTYRADPARTQNWSDLPVANKVASTLSGVTQNIPGVGWKMGAWPGGTTAWGTIRTELDYVGANGTIPNTGFYIHGGSYPGSAGCIDLTSNNNAFQGWLSSYGKPST